MLPGKQFTYDDALRILWRRKWLIALPGIAATLTTVALLSRVPDLYRSETVILVVPQRVPDSYVRSTVTAHIEDRLQSLEQQILSRSRLEPIILEFNLYEAARATRPMEEVVVRMRRDIVAQPVRGDAFRVSYVATDPGVAQKVTDRLASLFIEENLRDRGVLADATNQFLESQLLEARERLITHEKRLEAYRLRHAGELPNQLQSNMQAVQTLQVQVQGLTDSVGRDRDRRLMLERQLAEVQRQNQSQATTPDNGSTATAPSDIDALPEGSARRQLAAARQALQSLETRLKPEHPDIIRAKSIIADLEGKAREEQRVIAEAAASAAVQNAGAVAVDTSSAAERAVAELKSELARVTREITSKEVLLQNVQNEIDSYRAKLSAIPTRESEMTELMRDYDTLRTIYTDLLGKREASKVAANLERRQIGEQFRVLDPARKPELPFSPDRPYYTLVGSGAGLAFGLALIALLEFRDKTFHREQDVTQALGLPVLAVVPRMMNSTERHQQRLRMIAISGSAVLGAVTLAAFVAYRVWR